MPTVIWYTPEVHYFNSSLPLIDYKQKGKKEASNLFSDIEMPKEKSDDKEKDENYYPHVK